MDQLDLPYDNNFLGGDDLPYDNSQDPPSLSPRVAHCQDQSGSWRVLQSAHLRSLRSVMMDRAAELKEKIASLVHIVPTVEYGINIMLMPWPPGSHVPDEFPPDVGTNAISASAIAPDGTAHVMDALKPTDTLWMVKQKLEATSGISAGRQSLYVVGDKREGVENLELKDYEFVHYVRNYANMQSTAELQFAVVLKAEEDSTFKEFKAWVHCKLPDERPWGTCMHGYDHRMERVFTEANEFNRIVAQLAAP